MKRWLPIGGTSGLVIMVALALALGLPALRIAGAPFAGSGDKRDVERFSAVLVPLTPASVEPRWLRFAAFRNVSVGIEMPPPVPQALEGGASETLLAFKDMGGGERAAGVDDPMVMAQADEAEPTTQAAEAGPVAPSLDETGRVYTPTSRRDPIEPPLLESEIWQEWLLAVTLNGEAVSEATLFVQNPEDGSFAIDADALRGWRVRVDPADILTFQGNPFVPLDRLEGAVSEVDLGSLTLTLELPPSAFEATMVDLDSRPTVKPRAGVGGFFDYDLLYTDGTDLDAVLGGLFEAGAFSDLGHGIANFRIDALDEDPEFTRLETFARHDFVEQMATLRLGDSLTEGGSFAAGKRFGGIQFGTNFATDPSFVTFPRPAIGGLASQSSVVDVLIDNATRSTENVPPGPFSIENVPVVTGAGEVQLRVTDLLGREQIVTQPYYVSSRLLRRGLHEYAYGLGFERQDFGSESFEYGQPLANATHRLGVTDWFTAEAHGEAEFDRQSLILGGSGLMSRFGVLSAGVGGSYDEGDTGILAQGAYEYLAGRWNLGLRTRYTSNDFRQFGDEGEIRRVDQANVGFELGELGRMGLLFINRERIDEQDDQLATGTYSLPLGPGSLLFNAVQTFQPDTELALTATYSLPLGPKRSLSSSLERREGDYRGRVQYRRTRGNSDHGLDYRLAAEAGEGDTRIDGRFGYQTRYGSADLQLERLEGESNVRAGVSGSFAYVDGHVSASRRIGQAFGIVSMPGFADVGVLLDNREVGQTDADGQLMLPRLRAYEPNRVSFNVEDLPLEARVGFNEVIATPRERSGMVVDFGITRQWQATALLLDAGAAPLPSGLRLTDAEATVDAIVGRDGFTQITGGEPGQFELRGTLGERDYACSITIPADDTFAELGSVTCKG